MIHRFTQLKDEANKLIPGQRYTSFRSDIEQKFPLIQQHDPESADMAYMANVTKEMIHISGANVVVYPRVKSESYDNVWEEEADPLYKNGVPLKAFFVPKPIEALLTPWGVDVENKTTIVFCKEEIYEFFKERMLQIGDLIEVPYNSIAIKPDRYRVTNAAPSGNFRYHWYYFNCNVENISGDEAVDVSHK